MTLALLCTETLRRERAELEPVVARYREIDAEIRRRERADAVVGREAMRLTMETRRLTNG